MTDFSVGTHGPCVPLEVSSLVLRMSHPVCHQEDFCTTWGAIESAKYLAWECGHYNYSMGAQPVQEPEKSNIELIAQSSDQNKLESSCLSSRGTRNKHVQFQDLVQVHYDELYTQVTHTDLQNRFCKPWALFQDLPLQSLKQTFQLIETRECVPLSAQAVLNCPGSRTSSPTTRHASPQNEASEGPIGHMNSEVEDDRGDSADSAPSSVSRTRSASSSDDTHQAPSDSAPDWIHRIWHGIFVRQCEKDHRFAPSAITVLTWYLDHDRHHLCEQPRAVELTSDDQDWSTRIKRIWLDRFNRAQDFEVDIVHPEPPRGTSEFHQAQLIAAQSRRHDLSIVFTGVLEFEQGPKRAMRSAHVFPPRVNKYDVFRIINNRHLPHPSDCWVVVDEAVLGDQLQQLYQGASVEVHYVAPPQPYVQMPEQLGTRTRTYPIHEAGSDEVNLMARSIVPAPPDSPPYIEPDEEEEGQAQESESPTDDTNELPRDATWRAAAIFRLGHDGLFKRIRWNDEEVKHRQIAHFLAVSNHELVTYYAVPHGPVDLQSSEIILPHLQQDLRTGSTVKYVLLDVEFHNHLPALVPDVDRSCKLLASKLTRHLLLSVLGLIPYCREVKDACLVWKNQQLLPFGDPAPLNLQHGDYVKIAVPPVPDCPRIDTRTAALIHHHEPGAESYEEIMREMPEHMHIDQMPPPINVYDHLPFHDEVNLLQGQVRQHRLLEDVTSRIDEIAR